MAAPVLCIGCGCVVDDGNEVETAMPACSACWRAFCAVFIDGNPPAEGLELPEGPITRIADACLETLGRPRYRSVPTFTVAIAECPTCGYEVSGFEPKPGASIKCPKCGQVGTLRPEPEEPT